MCVLAKPLSQIAISRTNYIVHQFLPRRAIARLCRIYIILKNNEFYNAGPIASMSSGTLHTWAVILLKWPKQENECATVTPTEHFIIRTLCRLIMAYVRNMAVTKNGTNRKKWKNNENNNNNHGAKKTFRDTLLRLLVVRLLPLLHYPVFVSRKSVSISVCGTVVWSRFRSGILRQNRSSKRHALCASVPYSTCFIFRLSKHNSVGGVWNHIVLVRGEMKCEIY